MIKEPSRALFSTLIEAKVVSLLSAKTNKIKIEKEEKKTNREREKIFTSLFQGI